MVEPQSAFFDYLRSPNAREPGAPGRREPAIRPPRAPAPTLDRMIADALLGLGLVAIIEGLALALAPEQMREALDAIARMDPERRRLVGLLAVTLGIALVWVARA